MINGSDIKNLSEVSDILKSKVPYFEGEKKYFSTKGINNDGDYQSVNVTYNNKPSRAGLFPEINNVGFAKMKGTNKVFIVDKILKDSLFSTGFMILKCKDLIIPKYLFWFLLSENFLKQKDFLSGDGIMGGLKNSSHTEISIRIPELSEQKEIVQIVDQAFESIYEAKANIEKNIKNAKELFQSKLNQLFTEMPKQASTPLSNLCHIIGGGTPSKSNEEFYNGDINWATVRDMKEDIIENTELKINLNAVNNSSTNIIKRGNVIIATRVGLGKVCMISNDTAINQDLKGIIPNNNILPKYLFWWFKSIAKRIINEGTGATVQGVKLTFVKSLKIPLVSIYNQKEIVETLNIMDNHVKSLLVSYEEELKNLEELRKSILQKAFSGELTNKNKAA